MSDTKYRRILLKLSGEALGEGVSENVAVGLDFSKIHAVCEVIRKCHDLGVQIGLVIGGGNFWRGVKNGSGKMQRSHGDAMGMLATVMNAIAVADVLEQHGLDATMKETHTIALPLKLKDGTVADAAVLKARSYGMGYYYNGREVDKTNYPVNNELYYYKEKKFRDPWFADNVGSFLVVIERNTQQK